MVKSAKAKLTKDKLKKTRKGKVEKKKINKLNGRSKKRDPDDFFQNGDDSSVVKKRPSKVEIKSVIVALKNDATLILVRKALKYIPFYLKSEGLTKKLLKEITRLWADASEKIRIVCLLCLIRIYNKVKDKERRQAIIKKLYDSFLEKCRITKKDTMSMIGFMRHSFVELFKLDPQIAFKHAQTTCQQMAITLKNANTHKKDDSTKSVLNWQFANCLILLSQMITSHDDESPVKSLAQQVIQLNLDAINLLTSPRYYPFYCHLIENLIKLSVSANVFIPILPIILGILRRIQLPSGKQIKQKKISEEEEEEEETPSAKEYNMDLLNHVSLEEAHSLEYNRAVLDKIHELLLSYLASQCHKIAFPELVFLPCVQLKKWLKRNTGPEVQKFKVLLDKTKADCELVEESRKSIDFAFSNYSAVDAWEKKMRDSRKQSLPKLIKKKDE